LGHGVSTGQLFGIVFVLAGLAFKISAVPFHMWTPDVYEGAPSPVTAFFASAPKVAAMALLVRVSVEAMGTATLQWRQIVIFAALSGLSQTRPMLAAAMAMFMFSLAGIPGLFGFWPKFLVFDAAVQANLTWLAAVAIATSVISAFYYLMIVKRMYFDAPAPAYG